MSKFENIKKNFGFGCMRLPMKGEEVDHEEFSKMVDLFMASGFNYFDTAKPYIGGRSETAIKACLADRYPRESFVLTDKLTFNQFETEDDIIPLVERQLASCGVEYFDFYFMHYQNKSFFKRYREKRAYEKAFELKEMGKVKHVGISFHDTAEVLEEILTTYPDLEVVQLQFNYLDYEDNAIQSKKCYELCKKYGKPVMVMEPVKGGSLANLSSEAEKVFKDLGDGYSNASYAIRFAAGFDNIIMVLSGMSSLEQMQDNLKHMTDFKPLEERELEAIWEVRDIINSFDAIPCTACRYCVDGCPMNIRIPELFADMNAKKSGVEGNSDLYYFNHVNSGGKPEDCIKCGQCEIACPQHIKIRDMLEEVAKAFARK